MIYFDAHVHIQDIFCLDIFLRNSLENISKQVVLSDATLPVTVFLLLTEGITKDYFSLLKKESVERSGILTESWQINETREKESLLLGNRNWPGVRLFIIAGRQIVTLEKLEVLALGTIAKFEDGMSVTTTIEQIRQQQGLIVLPWGVGKWLGKRGKTVDNLIATIHPENLFVGDNGCRPIFWPTPATFALAAKRGIRLLSGSDPLPLAEEEQRAGSFGGFISGECTVDTPFADLKALLTDQSVPITLFGSKQGAVRFFKTQIALRMK